MKQSEFNVLVTNVSAIADQAFAVQCGEFSSAAADDGVQPAAAPFNPLEHIGNFDYQAVLESGYKSLESLTAEFNAAWEAIEQEKLAGLLENLPDDFARLTQPLTGDQLKPWIIHALNAGDESPFYALHHYLLGFFRGGYDETNDIIREAIAFDELAGLLEHERNIGPEHIQFDDLVTAATIQSFKVLEWLLKHAQLDDGQVVAIMESCFIDKTVFQRVYQMLSPTTAQSAAILLRAQAAGEDGIIGFIQREKTS
jgi:hypothetical protein